MRPSPLTSTRPRSVRATALANGAILTPDIDPFDLARVEVLRGPQGTLYGANSLGGLVKFVTVAPETVAFGGAAELGVEDVAHGDTAWWGRAAVNVPLSDMAAIRVSGFYRKDPGYIDDPNLGKDINDGKTYGGRGSFLVRPMENLTVRASVQLQNIRSNGTNEVDLNPVTFRPAYGRLTQSRILQQPNDINYRIYNGTIDYDFGSVGLLSSTSYGTLDQDAIVDASSVYGPLLSGFFGVPLGAAVDQGMTQRRFTQEVRLASTGRRTIDWIVGGFYTREKNELTQNLYGVDAQTGDLFPGLNGLILVALAVALSGVCGLRERHLAYLADVRPHRRWTDTAITSSRQSRIRTACSRAERAAFPASLPTMCLRTRSHRHSSPLPTRESMPVSQRAIVRADRTPCHRSHLRVCLESSARIRPRTTKSASRPRPTIALLTLEASAFLIDWKDIQLLAQVEGFGVNTNGGSARSKGVEVTASVNPTRALSLYAAGSNVDANLTKDAPAIVGGVKGDPLPYNPKWQWTLGADYEHPLSASTKARAGLSLALYRQALDRFRRGERAAEAGFVWTDRCARGDRVRSLSGRCICSQHHRCARDCEPRILR